MQNENIQSNELDTNHARGLGTGDQRGLPWIHLSVIGVCALVIVSILLAMTLFTHVDDWRPFEARAMLRIGEEQVISYIEEHDRLPSSLVEAGVPTEDREGKYYELKLVSDAAEDCVATLWALPKHEDGPVARLRIALDHHPRESEIQWEK